MSIFKADKLTTLGNLSPETRSNLSLNDPAVPLTAEAAWAEWFGGGSTTAAGELVSENNALTISTVYSCVTTLAEAVSSLPCKLMEKLAKGRSEATDQPLYFLLANEPNPEMTAVSFWATMVGCSALAGNAYAQILRDASGTPESLWPLHPLKTEPVRLPDGTLAFKTWDGQASGTYRVIAAKDVLHFPLFAWDGIKGISPVRAARESLALAKAAEKYGARFFGNGARADGILIRKGPAPDLKQKQEMTESWNRAHGGANAHKQGFLFGDWAWEDVGVSPEDSQFLATRGFQRADIAALFHVPAHMIGDMSKLSNNNHAQIQLSFITDTIRPILCRIEAELVRKLLPKIGRNSGRYYVSFDVSERLRGDFVTTQQGYTLGRNGGWLSVNDIRMDMGINLIGPEGDVYITPVNYQNAERLLDTESNLDQPIGTDPAPTPAERNLLGAYTRSYAAIYRDAFVRLSHRSRKDFDTLSSLFRPVLRSVADLVIDNAGGTPAPLDAPGDPADTVISDVIRGMAKRAEKWPADLSDAVMQAEFLKAVRSLHISISKELAGYKAAAQLTTGDAPDETA
jgi:HK97 family phage portal protein